MVYIQLPEDYAKSDKKYPVLYVTDGQWFFNSVLQAYYGQHYDSFVPDLIIISITWTGDYCSRKENSLYVSRFGGTVKLYAEAPESFYVKGLSGTGQFKKDDKGKVIAYYLVQNNNTVTFKKIK